MEEVCIAAFYRFAQVQDVPGLTDWIRNVGTEKNILGSVLVASEGVNATVAGSQEDIYWFVDAVIGRVSRCLEDTSGGEIIHPKYSWAKEMPFLRFRVSEKKEILTFGHSEANPVTRAGKYVEPKDWNALIEGEDVTVVDVRNRYEIAAGQFEGAVDPKTDVFTEFVRFVDEELAGKEDEKIAMYCTGGIRCEKATSYLLSKNFRNVFHLKGGILKYLEEIPSAATKWQGDCFVFDRRVTVGHRLQPTGRDMCHMCGWPLAEGDDGLPEYEAGVSCKHCFGTRPESQLASARERHKQIALAEGEGRHHIGPKAGKK